MGPILRSILAPVFLLPMLLCGCSAVETRAGIDCRRPDVEIAVDVTVLDAAGAVVPHVSMFSYTEPTMRDQDAPAIMKNLGAAWASAYDWDVAPWGQLKGYAIEGLTGQTAPSNVPIWLYMKDCKPDPARVVYLLARKEGYTSGYAKLTGVTALSGNAVTIHLRKREDQPWASQAYWPQYDALRYEGELLRDGYSKNDRVARLQEIKSSLEAVAAQALAAQDKRTAARIYLYMSQMAQVGKNGGRRIGEDGRWEYEAFQTDPLLPYIARFRVIKATSPPASALAPDRVKIIEPEIVARNKLLYDAEWCRMKRQLEVPIVHYFQWMQSNYGKIGALDKAYEVLVISRQLAPFDISQEKVVSDMQYWTRKWDTNMNQKWSEVIPVDFAKAYVPPELGMPVEACDDAVR